MTRTSCTDAWPFLDRALDINPRHGDTLRRVADCYMREGRIAEAEAAYRRAVNYIPFPDSLFFLTWAMSLEDTGRKDAAIQAYQQAAMIDPANKLIKEKLAALNAAGTQ
jgi:tetratricopeptide (TPR) repeat protein